MTIPKLFWSLQFTKGFQRSYRNLSELDMWRVDGFIRNVIYAKDPTHVYHHTPCVNCPPDFHLFGLSDNGLGSKGIEIQLWLQKSTNTIWFLKCRLAKKP